MIGFLRICLCAAQVFCVYRVAKHNDFWVVPIQAVMLWATLSL